MLDQYVSRRGFLGAGTVAIAAGLIRKLDPFAPPPTQPSTPTRTPTPAPAPPPSSSGELPHLAWVWQFDADGQPEEIAPVLSENSLGILLKTHNGSDWMSRWDHSMHAVTGPDQIAMLAGFFEGAGVPFHTWHVATGTDPAREAEMCAQAIAAGARSVTIDLEPFDSYWQGTPEDALTFGNEFRRRQPDAELYVTIDPRPWIISQTPVAEFASFSQGLAPMVYWDTFNSRDNVDLFRKHGFSPDSGVTPEFVLDVTQATLSPYGLPIYPAGEGATSQDAWLHFMARASELGMSSVSVWRYGVANGRVWPLLKAVEPKSGETQKARLTKGSGARVANTGMLLTIRSGPSMGSDIVAYFFDGTKVTLVDGPVEAEGYRWWQIESDQAGGWTPQGDLRGIPWLVPL